MRMIMTGPMVLGFLFDRQKGSQGGPGAHRESLPIYRGIRGAPLPTRLVRVMDGGHPRAATPEKYRLRRARAGTHPTVIFLKSENIELQTTAIRYIRSGASRYFEKEFAAPHQLADKRQLIDYFCPKPGRPSSITPPLSSKPVSPGSATIAARP